MKEFDTINSMILSIYVKLREVCLCPEIRKQSKEIIKPDTWEAIDDRCDLKMYTDV